MEYSHLKNIQIEGIDTYEISQLAEDEARDYYLNLLRDLPNMKVFNGRSITDLLTVKNRNYWWYLPISEKNIWVDKSIHRFYEIKKLKHILNIHEYDNIICNLSDAILQKSFNQMAIQRNINFTSINAKNRIIKWHFGALMFCFTYFINGSKAIAILLIKKLFVLNSKTNKKIDIANNTIGFFSFFPLFWQNIDKDWIRDIFFQQIPDEIAKNNRVVHFIFLSPWKKLLSKKNRLKKLLKNKNIYILENEINFKDALSLFNLDIYKGLLSILLSKRKVQLGVIEGIKIDEIVYDEFYRSFSSPEFFQALILDKALQKLLLEKCKLLFFRLEFQPHERAILYNTRGKVKSIGFQHSALSKNFLNYVFTNKELGNHWKNRTKPTSMPLPDHILTSGQVGFDFMINAGYPPKNTNIVGGVRFSDIYFYNKNKPNKIDLKREYDLTVDKMIIFLPTSLLIDETINMLETLIYSIKEKLVEYFLIIKCHPASNSKVFSRELNRFLNSKLDKNSYTVITQSINIYDYIYLSDLSIFLGGSMVIEALALNKQPIVFLPRNNFSHNPIADYLDSVQHVYDRTTMKNAINLFNNNYKPSNQDKVVIDMFYDLKVNPDERFMKIFKKVNREIYV